MAGIKGGAVVAVAEGSKKVGDGKAEGEASTVAVEIKPSEAALEARGCKGRLRQAVRITRIRNTIRRMV